MKKYLKELAILFIQLVAFYLYPIYALPIDPMGMVFIIIIITLLLSVLLGGISKNKTKFLYPIVIALLFMPSVFIYYNGSAMVHAVWYFVVSNVGIMVGVGKKFIVSKLK